MLTNTKNKIKQTLDKWQSKYILLGGMLILFGSFAFCGALFPLVLVLFCLTCLYLVDRVDKKR